MKTLSGIVVALTFVLSGTAAWADEDSSQNLWDYTFQLRAGAFFPDLDSFFKDDLAIWPCLASSRRYVQFPVAFMVNFRKIMATW